MIISIVTITYNNHGELRKTLASIPEFDFIESIVVNGGNPADSIDFLNSYRGKVINEKDEGIADAFNKGIKISSGNFIMFLSSGDILINQDYLLKAMQILKEKPEFSFIHSNILYSDIIGGELIVKPPLKNLGRGMKYLHPSMIIRKEVFNEMGYFNLNYKIAMDFDLIVRMEKKGLKGFYLNIDPVVKMGGEGKSHIEEFPAIKECIRSLKENDYLTIKNFTGLTVRLSLFAFRKIILAFGGKKFLRLLKRIKYSTLIC